jgi:glycogen(starch) synthase
VFPTIDVLANADLFVFPSLAEPQGLALVEAYAAGVPVVASRTGGIAEMLEDGVDGLLAEAGDVPGLSTAILRMIDDPALAQSCATRARRRLAMFDVTTIADTYIELYRSVAARHASLSPGRARPSAPDRP